MVDAFRSSVRAEVARQREGPLEYIRVYDSLQAIISGAADKEVDEFLAGEHKFEEYCKVGCDNRTSMKGVIAM